MDGDLASIYGNIHNEIHSGWAWEEDEEEDEEEEEGGRLPREPQPGRRIENMRKKYSQDSGEPGRGGVCEFYILPGWRGEGGFSPSRREKNSRLGKPSTLKQRCKLLFGASARKRSSNPLPPPLPSPAGTEPAKGAGREFTFQGVERGETNVQRSCLCDREMLVKGMGE